VRFLFVTLRFLIISNLTIRILPAAESRISRDLFYKIALFNLRMAMEFELANIERLQNKGLPAIEETEMLHEHFNFYVRMCDERDKNTD
jgi:hypothetical protein